MGNLSNGHFRRVSKFNDNECIYSPLGLGYGCSKTPTCQQKALEIGPLHFWQGVTRPLIQKSNAFAWPSYTLKRASQAKCSPRNPEPKKCEHRETLKYTNVLHNGKGKTPQTKREKPQGKTQSHWTIRGTNIELHNFTIRLKKVFIGPYSFHYISTDFIFKFLPSC